MADCVGDLIALRGGGLAAINVEVGLRALVQGHEVPGVVTDVMLAGSHDLVLRVIHELVPVGKPSYGPGDHEKHGEHVGGEAHGLVDDATVKVHIGVELPLYEVWIT